MFIAYSSQTFAFPSKGEESDGNDNHGTGCVEHHHEATAVFPVDDFACEREQKNLPGAFDNSKYVPNAISESWPADVPGHGSGVHSLPIMRRHWQQKRSVSDSSGKIDRMGYFT